MQKYYPAEHIGGTVKKLVWIGETIQARSPTLPAFLDQPRKAGTQVWNSGGPISPLQSFYLLEHQHSERQSVLIIRARFRYRPAHGMFSIRDFDIKDLLLHGVSYLWNRTASLWQYECQRIETRPFLMARPRGRACWAILLFIVVTNASWVYVCAENTF